MLDVDCSADTIVDGDLHSKLPYSLADMMVELRAVSNMTLDTTAWDVELDNTTRDDDPNSNGIRIGEATLLGFPARVGEYIVWW